MTALNPVLHIHLFLCNVRNFLAYHNQGQRFDNRRFTNRPTCRTHRNTRHTHRHSRPAAPAAPAAPRRTATAPVLRHLHCLACTRVPVAGLLINAPHIHTVTAAKEPASPQPTSHRHHRAAIIDTHLYVSCVSIQEVHLLLTVAMNPARDRNG